MSIKLNKARQHNSFCAGAREYKKKLLEVVTPLLPPTAVVDLDRIMRNVLSGPEFAQVSHDKINKWRRIQARKVAGNDTRN